MSSLQVRDLPENIYYQLQKNARAEHRSLAQEAVVVLARGLKVSACNRQRRVKLLELISLNTIDATSDELIDPVDLIREDRER
jgi:plasmid stability protein